MVANFERNFDRGIDFLVKYTMPIFLMHMFFAALGFRINFAGSIIAAWIMKKTKYLEFFCIRINYLNCKEEEV